MEYNKLQSKAVIGRNGKKIGIIVRIDDSVIIGNDETDPYAIIKIQSFPYYGKIYPMPLLEITEYRVLGDEMRLEITKKQFMQIFRQYLAERKQRIKAAKMAGVDKNDMAMAVNYRTKF